MRNVQEMSDRELRRYRGVLRLRRERRKRIMATAGTVLAVFCMVLICSLSYGSISTRANTGYKYYKSVTIAAGESLWELADSYIDYDYYKDKNAYIAEVQSINHIEDASSVSAGQEIVVPYYSSEYVY